MRTFFASTTVLLTILLALAFGVACGYAAIYAILRAFGHRTEQAPAVAAVAVPSVSGH